MPDITTSIERHHSRRRSTPHLSRQEHADRINSCWRKTVDAIIETGRALIKAKAQLEAHQFKAMVKQDLAVTRPTATKLMLIAEKEVLVDHKDKLPACWRTIYELSQLDDDKLLEAIESGHINPKMHRDQACGLRLRPPRAAAASPEPAVTADIQELCHLWRQAFGAGEHRFAYRGVSVLRRTEGSGQTHTVAEFNNAATAELVAKVLGMAAGHIDCWE
jgi:hypothetical protein